MYVSTQALDFVEFVLIGTIIGIIFDFFRGYRKVKQTNTTEVIIQDIVYFILATIIIIFSIINLLDSQIRLYIFIALLLGCTIYFSTISRYIIKLYILFFQMANEIISTIFLPLILGIQIFQKICKILKKIWKKCCKLFLYMISYVYNILKMIVIKTTSMFKVKNKKQKRFWFMKKKVDSNMQKKVKKRKFGMIHILTIGFAVYFVYTLVEQQVQINKYDSQIKMYTADIQNKSNLSEYYNNQKDNTKTDQYIETVARESLGYVKPYEKIFVDANK